MEEEKPIITKRKRGEHLKDPDFIAKKNEAVKRYWAERHAREALLNPPKIYPLEGTIYAPATFVTPEIARQNIPVHARDHIVDRIFKKKDKLIDAQIDAATGLYYVTQKGDHVYQKLPNTNTGEYLLNQLIGKPKESIDVQTEIRLNVDI
jgi:hypothetical protein